MLLLLGAVLTLVLFLLTVPELLLAGVLSQFPLACEVLELVVVCVLLFLMFSLVTGSLSLLVVVALSSTYLEALLLYPLLADSLRLALLTLAVVLFSKRALLMFLSLNRVEATASRVEVLEVFLISVRLGFVVILLLPVEDDLRVASADLFRTTLL